MAGFSAYEGASHIAREIALWQPASRSADGDLNNEKGVTDSRVRDLYRNDGYIKGAVSAYQDGIVGGQYRLNATPNLIILSQFNPGFNSEWSENFQQQVESLFTLWAESHNNYADASRINTFSSIIRLGIAGYLTAGEILATAEWKSGSPLRTCIQMIDTDRLCNPNNSMDTATMRRGIERKRSGEPIAYHIRDGFQGDNMFSTGGYIWRRIPAKKPWGRQQVIHIFEQSRPDQSRGVSDLVSVLKTMKMTKNFQDIVLQNAALSATVAATIESEMPPAEAYAALGMGDGSSAAEAYMKEIAVYAGGSRNMQINDSRFVHLYPGSKLNLQQAGEPNALGGGFESSLLRHVAASLGLSYEQFSRDYTQTTYSSARASMLETWKRFNSRKRAVTDKLAGMIYMLFLEEVINNGMVELPAGVDASFFYQGMNKEAICSASWIGANRGQIDELKETQAAALRLEKGLSTLEEETARLGKDWRDVITQRAREKQELVNAGLEGNPQPVDGS